MSLADFEDRFGKPAGKALSRLIRPMITAPEGKTFVWGDWSNIEARGLPWLAEAETRLDVFREIDSDPAAPDVYIRSVAGMYDLDLAELWRQYKAKEGTAKADRQKGKIAELSLGFSGGPGALQSMAANYGMSFGADEAQDIVTNWRKSNDWAEVFWDEVWDAFCAAVNHPDGTMFPAGRVNYQGMMVGDQIWVVCYLPDGFPLFYRNVRDRKQTTYDEFEPDVIVSVERKLSFESEKGLKFLWRGILVENITQAACARILRQSITSHSRSTHAASMPIVGHTHDEIVLLVPNSPQHIADAKEVLYERMTEDAGWHDGLPLEVDLDNHPWYSKAIDE